MCVLYFQTYTLSYLEAHLSLPQAPEHWRWQGTESGRALWHYSSWPQIRIYHFHGKLWTFLGVRIVERQKRVSVQLSLPVLSEIRKGDEHFLPHQGRKKSNIRTLMLLQPLTIIHPVSSLWLDFTWAKQCFLLLEEWHYYSDYCRNTTENTYRIYSNTLFFT